MFPDNSHACFMHPIHPIGREVNYSGKTRALPRKESKKFTKILNKSNKIQKFKNSKFKGCPQHLGCTVTQGHSRRCVFKVRGRRFDGGIYERGPSNGAFEVFLFEGPDLEYSSIGPLLTRFKIKARLRETTFLTI